MIISILIKINLIFIIYQKKKNIKYNSERYKKKFKMKDEIYLNLWHSNDDVEEDQ